MPSEQIILGKTGPGTRARQRRLASLMTRRELADMAGIPVEHVSLYEQGLPVPLDSRRRILRELWANKNGK